MNRATSLVIYSVLHRLIMWIGHGKEILKLTVRALAVCQREWANTKNVNFQTSWWWPIHIINPGDKNQIIVQYSLLLQHHSFFRNMHMYIGWEVWGPHSYCTCLRIELSGFKPRLARDIRELKHWRWQHHGRRLVKIEFKFTLEFCRTKPVQSANLSKNLLKLNI